MKIISKKLENAFTLTVTSSLNNNNKKFGSDTNLFNHHRDHLLIKDMERKSKTDIKKFFPGKEIESLKDGFSAERFLKKLKLEDFPKELGAYLTEIKDFFESD